MKKLLSALVAVVFVAGFVGFATAQTSTPTEKKPATMEKKADDKAEKKADKAAEKMDKKPASKTANGTVKSAAAGSIVVAGKEKGKEAEWTFAVDASTKIKKAGKDAAAADVKAGDAVTVKYMEKDGKATAQMVTVKAMAAAKKAENPCAAKK